MMKQLNQAHMERQKLNDKFAEAKSSMEASLKKQEEFAQQMNSERDSINAEFKSLLAERTEKDSIIKTLTSENLSLNNRVLASEQELSRLDSLEGELK